MLLLEQGVGPGDLWKFLPASTITCDSVKPQERPLALKLLTFCVVAGKLSVSSSPLLQSLNGKQFCVTQYESLDLQVNGQILLFVTPI